VVTEILIIKEKWRKVETTRANQPNRPDTSGFKRLPYKLLGHDSSSPGTPEERKEVSFVDRNKRLGFLKICRECLAVGGGERLEANNVQGLQRVSRMRRKHCQQYSVGEAVL
jgi:hypothetical protein